MLLTVFKIIVASALIVSCSWLANKKPVLAGFLLALPLTSMLALLFNYVEFQQANKSIEFAKSIFLAVPLSLTFFVPFLFPSKVSFGFYGCFVSGVIFLGCSYFVHDYFLG